MGRMRDGFWSGSLSLGSGSGRPKGQLELFSLPIPGEGDLPLGEKERPKREPMDPIALQKTESRRGKVDKAAELEVWRRYRSGDKAAFRELLNGGEHGPGYRPMLYGSPIGRRYLGDAPLPRSSIKAELLQNFKRGLDTYEEGKGAALGTWIWTNLQKTSRYVTTYAPVAKIPESRVAMVRTYIVAREELEAALGREPSDHEVGAKLGWSQKQVDTVRTEARKDILMQPGLDEAPQTADITEAMDTIHYIHPTLDPEAKRVLEHTYGLFGKREIEDNNEMALELGITANRVRAVKRKIAKAIEKHRG